MFWLQPVWGEEGLDVPNADLVIFYEPVRKFGPFNVEGVPVGSAQVQHVLIAKDTRDEGASSLGETS